MAQIDLRQTNAYAMQYGVVLGIWNIITLAVFVASLINESYSVLAVCLGLVSLIIATALTKRFRKQINADSSFTIFHGFIHTLLMSVFASLWVALFVYMYMQFADTSWIFNAYEALLSEPIVQQTLTDSGMMDQLEMITGSNNLSSFVEMLRDIPAVSYAASFLYMNLFTAPIISLLIGVICRRNKK